VWHVCEVVHEVMSRMLLRGWSYDEGYDDDADGLLEGVVAMCRLLQGVR